MSERDSELEKGVSRGREFCLSISLFICFCVHSRISKNFNLPKICAHMCVPCAPTHPLPHCSVALPLPLPLALALTLALASHLHWISDSKLPSLLLWNAVTINEFSTINIPKFCPGHTRTHTSTHTRRERQAQAQAHTHE